MWPTGEMSMLELTQLILLGISACFWVRRAEWHSVWGAGCVFMTCIAIACIGRESSWGSAYGISETLSDRIELVAAVTLSAVGVALFIVMFKQVKNIVSLLQYAVVKDTIAYLAISFICLLLGDIFDHKLVSIYASPLIEESCEVIAYLYYCRAAYIFTAAPKAVSTA